MAYQPQVCIKAVQMCVMMAATYGLAPPQLLAEYGLDPAVLADPYSRVPHTLVARLWQELPQRVGDEAFGLHAAERWGGQARNALDNAIAHCRTLGDALALLSRYVRLLHDGCRVDVVTVGDAARCILRGPPGAELPRHLIEQVLTVWVLRSSQLLGRAVPLHEVSFAHAAPAQLDEHRRVLGLLPRFGAADNAITLDAACLDAAVVGADPLLGMVLHRHLRDEFARLPPPDDFLAAVQRAARESLADSDLDIDRLARRLHTSQRTLQRRLSAAGTSFQVLIEQARRDGALHLLQDPRLTLAEVAVLTGYSDLSAFHRAFRRWTGRTRREYRDSPGR